VKDKQTHRKTRHVESHTMFTKSDRETCIETDRYKDEHIDVHKLKDGRMHEQKAGQIKEADIQTYRHTDTHEKTDRHGQKDIQTNRWTGK